MKLRNKILRFFLLLLCHSIAMADTEQLVLHEQPTAHWTIDCELSAPEGFAENVMIYQYVQQKAADKLKDIKQAQHSTAIPLRMVADKHRSSLIYASPAACMLTIPEAAAEDDMSEEQEQLINHIMTCLTDADFHPYGTPYSVFSLQSTLDKQNAATIGAVLDWNAFAKSIRNENQLILEPNTQYVVLASEIDGYPIDPHLYGSYSDSAVPMYAKLLIHHNELQYMEVGCSYTIPSQKMINQPLISWTDAVETAARSLASEWIPAWQAMSSSTDAGFDYPSFFTKYDPTFSVTIHSVKPMYYAVKKELRPGWKVTASIEIELKNDDALTKSERHRYVWEQYVASYMIDAVTGEHVR